MKSACERSDNVYRREAENHHVNYFFVHLVHLSAFYCHRSFRQHVMIKCHLLHLHSRSDSDILGITMCAKHRGKGHEREFQIFHQNSGENVEGVTPPPQCSSGWKVKTGFGENYQTDCNRATHRFLAPPLVQSVNVHIVALHFYFSFLRNFDRP